MTSLPSTETKAKPTITIGRLLGSGSKGSVWIRWEVSDGGRDSFSNRERSYAVKDYEAYVKEGKWICSVPDVFAFKIGLQILLRQKKNEQKNTELKNVSVINDIYDSLILCTPAPWKA